MKQGPVKGRRSNRERMWKPGRFQSMIPDEVMYTAGIKALVRRMQGRKAGGLISDFLRARRGLRATGVKIAGAGKLVVEDITNRVDGYTGNAFYKVTLGRRSFFVKEYERGKAREKLRPQYDLAAQQMSAMREASALIAKAELPNVAVAEYSLGYTGKTHSWIVSDFYEGETVGWARAHIPNEILPIESGSPTTIPWARAHIPNEIWVQTELATSILRAKGFVDVTAVNMLWCPKLEKIVIIDLRKVRLP
ncbi:MAG: hypothetical protein HY544_04070 [Candidatus Diapherotrites archaeon]|uniref:Uncharacterized protein n=1 Tax=Candidatus Iainarchaeum sp. TaxID=3101447 RepID=A0A8T3YK88_9ARCH|nr:hypothetical protein [Candidatus Diapherotrites archaeon]